MPAKIHAGRIDEVRVRGEEDDGIWSTMRHGSGSVGAQTLKMQLAIRTNSVLEGMQHRLRITLRSAVASDMVSLPSISRCLKVQ